MTARARKQEQRFQHAAAALLPRVVASGDPAATLGQLLEIFHDIGGHSIERRAAIVDVLIEHPEFSLGQAAAVLLEQELQTPGFRAGRRQGANREGETT